MYRVERHSRSGATRHRSKTPLEGSGDPGGDSSFESPGELFYEVPEGVERERADKVLAGNCPELSRSAVQRLFEAGLVWRDNAAIRKSQKVSAGDSLSYTIPAVEPLDLTPADIRLEVIFEDEDLVAVSKAAGMVVHPGAGTGGDTLVHALLFHCKGQLSGIGGVERPGIVHRLDKDTTGVIVAAKTDAAFQGLSRQFAEREVNKMYLALVSGSLELDSGRINLPIGRHPAQRHKMAVSEKGRPALTDWEVVERFGEDAALMRVRIHTGRTHQIRVHLADYGVPLVGDTTYGYRKRGLFEDEPVRVMLHAMRLELKHPVSGKEIVLEAKLPEDFEGALRELR